MPNVHRTDRPVQTSENQPTKPPQIKDFSSPLAERRGDQDQKPQKTNDQASPCPTIRPTGIATPTRDEPLGYHEKDWIQRDHQGRHPRRDRFLRPTDQTVASEKHKKRSNRAVEHLATGHLDTPPPINTSEKQRAGNDKPR